MRRIKKQIFKVLVISLCAFISISPVFAINASSFSPADNATGVGVSDNLSITFNEAANYYMMGSLYIYDANGNLFESFPIGNMSGGPSARISGWGTSTITIDPTNDMVSGKNYYVQIDNWAIADSMYSNYYTISDTTTWNFSVGVVADVTAPTATSYTPTDNSTGIPISSSLKITFDEAVDLQTGNVTIKLASNDSIVETIAINSAKVTGNGTTAITINPANGLTANTSYYVNIDATAIDDLAANSYAGISNTTTWNFTTAAEASWYNASWAYRKKITIPASKVNGDVANFPVYVNLNDLGTTFFDYVKSDGSDIVVTDLTGTTKLSRDLSAYDATNNSGALWFKAAALSNLYNGEFYIYYGYSSASETNATATWNGEYIMSIHFDESASGSANDADDETSNNNSGTSQNSISAAEAGKIEKAWHFDGSNDYINFSDINALDGMGDYTLSTWYKRDNSTTYMNFGQKGGSGGTLAFVTSTSTIYSYPTETEYGSMMNNSIYGSFSNGSTAWKHLVYVFNGSATGITNKIKVYLDGTEQTLSTGGSVGTTSGSGSDVFSIGYDQYMGMNYMDGLIDEYRIANKSRSKAWIKTEYDNQYSSSTFYSVGSQTTNDSTPPTVSSFSPADNATGVSLTGNLSLAFSEAIDIQTGNINIYENGVGLFETISVTSGQVSGNGGTTIYINPTNSFNGSSLYYIRIDATAFDDTAGNSYAGISNNGTWNFTTAVCDNSEKPSDWYDCHWNKRIKITIDDSKVNGSVANFPVYVNLNGMPATFFDTVLANGADLRVTKSNGTSEVAREVVWLNKTSNAGELHFVANGTLSNTANSDYYLYYGNGTATEPSASATYGKNNVWANSYAGAWHLQESPAGSAPQMQDSTSSNYDGTSYGTMTNSDLIAGKLSGNGYDLDGINDYVALGDIDVSAITISAWVKPNANTNAYVVNKNYASGVVPYSLNTQGNAEATDLDGMAYYGVGGWNHSGTIVTNIRGDGSWHYVVGTYSSTDKFKYYVDGVLRNSSTSGSGNLPTNNASADMGRYANDGHYFGGLIDELHIASVARNGSWVKTEYNNQNSPASFYRLTSPEDYASDDTTDPTISSFSPADNATGVAINSNLVMNFDESVSAQSGNINIYSGNGSLFASIAVGSGNVSGSGTSTITINPSSDFTNARTYYVLVDATAFDDSAGNSYAGISDPSTWSFVTVASGGGDVTGPSVSHFSPPDNGRFVQSYSGVSMIFDETVQAGSGSVIIKRSSDNAVLDTIPVSSSNITGWGTNTITIKHSAALTNNTGYYVQVDTGAILDLSGNSFSGVSGTSTWNFNTKSTPNTFMGGGL